MGTLSLLLRLLTLVVLLGLLGLWLAKRPALRDLAETAAEGREQLALPADAAIPAVLRQSLAQLGETRERLARSERAGERLAAENRTLREDLDSAEKKVRSGRQELRAAREGLAEAERRAAAAEERTGEITAELEEERRAQITLTRRIARLREDLLAAQRETTDLRTRLAQMQPPDHRSPEARSPTPEGATAALSAPTPEAAAPRESRVEIARIDRERGLLVLRREPGADRPAGQVLTLMDGSQTVARLRLRRSHPRFLLVEWAIDADPGLPLREGSVFTIRP